MESREAGYDRLSIRPFHSTARSCLGPLLRFAIANTLWETRSAASTVTMGMGIDRGARRARRIEIEMAGRLAS